MSEKASVAAQNSLATFAQNAPPLLSDIAESKLRLALDAAVLQSLRPIAAGLSILYLIFAVSHAVFLPPRVALPLAITASLTAAILLLLYVILGRLHVSASLAHPIGAGIAGLVLFNSLLHLHLLSEPEQTTNVALLVIGSGCLLLSARWLALVLALSLSGWTGLVLTQPPSPAWRHFGFMLLAATVLSVLVQMVRIRNLRQLHRMHLRDEERRRELQTAIEAQQKAQSELESRVEERTIELSQANASLRDAEQRAIIEYEGLLDHLAYLAQMLGTAPDLLTVFRALRDFAVISTPCSGLFISLYDPARKERTAAYAFSEGEEVDLSTLPPMPMSDSPHSRAVATGRIIVTDDFQAAMANQPVINVGLERDPQLPQSSLAAPMAVMGRVVGAIEVQSTTPAAFTEEHTTAMRMAANLAAIAIENVQLFERESSARAAAEAAERRSGFLAEASSVLASSLDYEATLASVARMAVPNLADWCTVDVVEDEGSIRRLAVTHPDPSKVEWAHELQRRYPDDPEAPRGVPNVLRTGRSEIYSEIPDSLLVAVAKDAEHLRILRDIGFSSAMIVPLSAHGRTLGAMSFISAESGRHYGPADLALAENLAQRAGLAIDNARLYRDAREANRIKDEFLATVSHELRTPLTSILGWAHLLRAGQLGEASAANALEVIERNARSQAQLIDDLLDVSRIITGKLRLDVQPVDPAWCIEAAVEAVRPAADAKGIRLQKVIETGVSPVAGDPARLQQVVWNLLSNAIKFTPRGGRVWVRLERVNSHIEITVSDTGAGISREFLPFVFDRFRQADQTITRAHGGLGLGLAITRHLVELHGGAVHAESPGEGQGATFTVKLPPMTVYQSERSPKHAHPKASDVHSLADCPERLDGLKLLVVDDEADTRELLGAVLEQCGAEVTAVGSAEEALEALEKLHPNVLMSDIGMLGEDGYALIRKVRALPAERGGGTPAVALTAYARTEDRVRALSSGYQVHIAKPVEPAELIAAVASLAGRTA